MATTNLRPTLSRRLNSENDGVVGVQKVVGKAAIGVPGVGGLKTRPARGAMQEIGNNAASLANRATTNKAVGKPEAVKPPRGLVKQKAVVSLKNVGQEIPTRVMPKRKSAEKSAEPMEISRHEETRNEDVEMEEMDVETKNQFCPVAFSAERLALVEDIDKDDQADPQLVTEYVNQIYLYLRQMEIEQNVEEDYLGNKKGGVIMPKMRAVLIDWLVEVHQQFSMLQETLYLTVAILDRYLQKAASTISRKSLQLVGVTAMFIASKYEEMYAPEIGDFVYITDNAYNQSQIRQQEIEILKVLNFDLGRPLPLHFLRRNSKAGCVDARVHTLAKYIMELTIIEYNLMHIAPSKLAAASLVISIKFFDDDADKPVREYWTPTLAYYTLYEWPEIAELVNKLLMMIKKTCEARPDAKLMAIRQKYSNKKFAKIALIAQQKLDLFNQMTVSDFSTSSPK